MLLQAALPLAFSTMIIAGALEKPESPEHPPSNRRIRRSDCPSNGYPHEERCCLKCPAGTRVLKHCTQDGTEGLCVACTPGRNFTSGPNGMESCISCHPCRPDDQVQLSECTATADYQCQCKPNTFCTDSCNILCTKCSRCPKGHHVIYPCTPTTDTVCEENSFTYLSTTEKPETASASDGNNLALGILLPLLSVAVVAIIILVIILWKTKKKDKETTSSWPGAEQQVNLMNESIGNPSEASTPEARRVLPVPGHPALEQVVNVGAADDARTSRQHASETEQLRNCPEGSPLLRPCVTHTGVRRGVESAEESQGEESKPSGGKACGQQLTDIDWLECYNCLKEYVLPDKWKALMRNLGLRDTDIQIIHMDHHGIQEQNYQMFHLWRQQEGHRATMHDVLCVLNQMHLGGCGEKIVSSLTSKGIHVT